MKGDSVSCLLQRPAARYVRYSSLDDLVDEIRESLWRAQGGNLPGHLRLHLVVEDAAQRPRQAVKIRRGGGVGHFSARPARELSLKRMFNVLRQVYRLLPTMTRAAKREDGLWQASGRGVGREGIRLQTITRLMNAMHGADRRSPGRPRSYWAHRRSGLY